MSQILFGTQSRVFQIVTAAPTNVLSSNPNCESNEDTHIKCNPRQSGGKGKRVHWSPYRGSPRKRKSCWNCTAKTTIVNQQSKLFRHYRPFGCFSSRLNPISQIFFHDRLHDLGLLGQINGWGGIRTTFEFHRENQELHWLRCKKDRALMGLRSIKSSK